MPLGWLLFLIWAPIACAVAGAIPAWLFTRAHCERKLDAVYEDGWRAGRQWYPPEVGSMTLDAERQARGSVWLAQVAAVDVDTWQGVPASDGAQGWLSAPVPPAEALAALPAPGGEGARHAAPESAPLRLSDLEAIGRVRAEFARIRASLGLRV